MLPDNYSEAQAEARADIRIEARELIDKAWDLIHSVTRDAEGTFEILYDELVERSEK